MATTTLRTLLYNVKMHMSVILHNVRSVHNVGSIFRTADAAGVSKIFCCGITPIPLDRLKRVRPDFAKVALGAEEYLSWEHAKSAAQVMRKLKKERWTVCAIEQSKRSTPYFKMPARESSRVALVLGNEVRGLPASLLRRADHILEIPMLGKKESLNVAVAFGIAAFGLRVRSGTI